MNWLTLPEAKAHLKVEHDAEDDLISGLIDAAEDYVSQFLNRAVPWTDDNGDPVEVPAMVRQAALMLIDHWYNNRSAVLTGSISKELEFATNSLLHFYRVGLGV